MAQKNSGDDQDKEELIECQHCAEMIKAEAILCQYCGKGLSTEFFRECPTCQEMVRKEATLCKYCKTSIAAREDKSVENPGALPLSILSPTNFLPFLREVEKLVVEEKLRPLIVFWSRQNAARLLPEGSGFRELMRDAHCVSIFSEDRVNPPDEWCFLLESHGLCMVVYGQTALEDGEKYQCSGSMDPALVKQAFQRLLPKWQDLDLTECNRLEDARAGVGETISEPVYMKRVLSAWPIINEPKQRKSLHQFNKPGDNDLSIHAGGPPDFSVGLRASGVTEEPPPMPLAAQSIVSEVLRRLRHEQEPSTVLQFAIERLVLNTQVDRGLVWRVEGDHLKVANEFALSGNKCFLQNQLTCNESMSVAFEFLSRFPDETGVGVISIPNIPSDTDFEKLSPTIASLNELSGTKSSLLAQLRSRGIFQGFLELQQCSAPREWNPIDIAVLEKTAEVLAIVVQQSTDHSKIKSDAQQMKLLNEIANLFRESNGKTTNDSLAKAVELAAKHMGFTHSEIYLYNKDENVLQPHSKSEVIALSDNNNPFVEVYKSGRGKMINIDDSRKVDPFFNHDMAMVMPLYASGVSLGAFGMWQRVKDRPDFRPQDRELGLTIATIISMAIRS